MKNKIINPVKNSRKAPSPMLANSSLNIPSRGKITKRFASNEVKFTSSHSGFTLVELIISFSILIVIILVAGIFIQNILNFGTIFKNSFEAKSEINQLSQSIGRELRATTISNTGSYPLETTASSTLAFYSDIEGDGIMERIRYFLDDATLKKGILRPSGNPLAYNPANETITEVVHNVILSASSTFSYYDSNYTGSESPLSFPINTSLVRLINLKLTAQNPSQSAAATIDLKLVPRNLRSNL